MEIEVIRNKKKVTRKDGKEKDFLPYTYLVSESMDMWTQSHDGGRHFRAMTIDANNKVFLLTFVVVDCELGSS